MTVRGSSTSFDSRASRARLDRAFLGFLIVNWPSIFPIMQKNKFDKHYAEHIWDAQLQYVFSFPQSAGRRHKQCRKRARRLADWLVDWSTPAWHANANRLAYAPATQRPGPTVQSFGVPSATRNL